MFAELTSWDYAAIIAKLFAYGGGLISAGSVLFILANSDLPHDLLRRLKKLVMLAVIIAAAASMAQFGIQSGRLLDEGLAGMVDPEMFELVKDGPLGDSVFIRLIGLMLVFLFALSIPRAWVSGAFGSLIIAVSFSLVGHGTNDPQWLLGSLVTLHLLGVSFWLGALWPLKTAANGAISIQHAAGLAHRFGWHAGFVVGGLIVAGGVLIYLLVGSVNTLLTSQYGWTLLIKLAVVASLLFLAAANKFRFVPAMLAGDAVGAQRLRRSITLEMIAVSLILLITAFLTTVTALPEMPAVEKMEMKSDG